MSEGSVRLAFDLLDCAIAVAKTRPRAAGVLEPYADSVDLALGSLLEFYSAVVAGLAAEGDPYREIGSEPKSHLEAVRTLPGFLDLCRDVFSGEPPFPFMCVSVRSQTYACLLLEVRGPTSGCPASEIRDSK